MSDRTELSTFLREVISWDWMQFCKAEKDPKYTSLQATVFSLIRTTSEGKLGAIKLAIARIDGKVVTPIKVEYPKIYFLYPHAKSVAGLPEGDIDQIKRDLLAGTDPIFVPDEEPEDLATFTLRDTLRKMSQTDRPVVPLILRKKKEVEQALQSGEDVDNIPLVKSVVAANLLHLAIEKNNFEAITEVFDQLEGRLVETYQVLGEDLFLTQYADIAPAGAVLNADGVYQLEHKQLADAWASKFEQTKK